MRAPVRAVAAIITAGVAATATACGSAQAPGTGAAAAPTGSGRTQAAPGTSPAVGSRSGAAALAATLLSRVRLPAGAHRADHTPLPRSLRNPGLMIGALPTALDRYALFRAREPMAAVAAYLWAHTPAQTSRSSQGRSSGPPGVTNMTVSDMAGTLPRGIYQAQLMFTVVPATGGALVRADAQVIWYPRRSAAEYIIASRYHVLAITETMSDAGPKPRVVHKTVTSRAAIAALATVLNRSPAQPDVLVNCPAEFASYQLTLAATARSRPAVVVTAAMIPCGGVRMVIDGQLQPTLQNESAVVSLASKLTGVAPHPHE